MEAVPLSVLLVLKLLSGPVGKAGKAFVASLAEKESQRSVQDHQLELKNASYLQVKLGKALMLQTGPDSTGDRPVSCAHSQRILNAKLPFTLS